MPPHKTERIGRMTAMEAIARNPELEVVFGTHWVIEFKRKFVSQHSTRKIAEDCAIALYKLDAEQAAKLRRSLVVRIPRVGLVEISSCDCTDGKHEPEPSQNPEDLN